MRALQLPAGYWTTSSRDEFNTPCVALHHESTGWLSDHDCEAEAIYAAQDDAAEREAEQASDEIEPSVEDYRVESAMLDEIYRQVSFRFDADLPVDHPRNKAVRLALKALDGISAPVSGDQKEAA